MTHSNKLANIYFGLLLLAAGSFLGVGIFILGKDAAPGWVETVQHVCEQGWQNFRQHSPLAWQVGGLRGDTPRSPHLSKLFSRKGIY